MAAPQVFNYRGRVVNYSMPYKAVLEFEYEGRTRRGLMFANRLHKEDGETYGERTVILHVVEIGEYLQFDGHELTNTGPEKCDWIVKRAWRKGSKVPIFGTGTVIDLGPRHGAIYFENEDDEYENRVFFMASKFYYFGKKLKNKSLLEIMEDGHKVQFEAVENESLVGSHEGGEAGRLQRSCKYFARTVWKGQKPPLKRYEQSTASPADSPRKQASTSDSTVSGVTHEPPTTFTYQYPQFFPKFSPNNDELTSGNRMLADFWHAKFLEAQSTGQDDGAGPKHVTAVKGKGTFWNFLDFACGLLLWERSAVERSRTLETVFFHRQNLTLAGESLADKDLVAVIPEGCSAEFDVVPAPEEMPCEWVAVRVAVIFS